MKLHVPIRFKRGEVSFLVHKKAAAMTVVLLIVCAVIAIVSTGLGEMYISPTDVIRGIMGIGAEDHAMVIQKLRLPRIVVSMLVGASLAAAGAILQGIIRNPLASPDMMGITGGASVAAVTFLTYFAGIVSIRWLPVTAMIGAAVVSAILYLLAWKRGVTPIRLILVGIGMSSLMSAATTMMIVFSPSYDPSQAYLWLTGSVYASNWENVFTVLPWTVILIPLAFLLARHVNIGQLGDDIAASTGSAVEVNRLLLLLISVALAGSAVSVAGGIGFIGLIAPHMARKLVGSSFESVLPVSALLGSAIVMLADLAGRTFFLPLDVPVGVFTSAVGAPFFIYLLYTKRNSR
ncbi:MULTISPECIES: iron chelate uptake ABC transporter family permease subunit [unclassified Paenibacillus]|uniref:FecCD family ABC transporter permease n=1 Tax=unclassified Paenibacillus TaxID=185978 RepID=UPI00277D2445|nr:MULTISPECIES: iron ABC transporter permease [unclassified Paenibacillus]MDQ0902735.1 iron complex transport system permease protein [Paenibacillus sp. V4I7]MDQ0918753.1 iron complex transport system permease protein [Paenibacillus sp. V4I5]